MGKSPPELGLKYNVRLFVQTSFPMGAQVQTGREFRSEYYLVGVLAVQFKPPKQFYCIYFD